MKLTDEQIAARLDNVPGWTVEGEELVKEFKFSDFTAAFAFMTAAAAVADKLNHHPDWRNVYNRVEVRLTTHDAGGVTEKDFELAAEMNRLCYT